MRVFLLKIVIKHVKKNSNLSIYDHPLLQTVIRNSGPHLKRIAAGLPACTYCKAQSTASVICKCRGRPRQKTRGLEKSAARARKDTYTAEQKAGGRYKHKSMRPKGQLNTCLCNNIQKTLVFLQSYKAVGHTLLL